MTEAGATPDTRDFRPNDWRRNLFRGGLLEFDRNVLFCDGVVTPMKDLRNILAAFARASGASALATVVETAGSSYRRAGARMLVLADGTWTGTLSGGCVEEETAARAMPVIIGGKPELFTIDTQRRFGCPGSLAIFIERVEPRNAFLAYLAHAISRRQTAETVVIYDPAQDGAGSYAKKNAPSFAKALEEKIAPPVRMAIAGTGADTDALAAIGHVLGWDVAVLEQPELIEDFADERTALVIKNHHFGRDTATLARGFSARFGYVGLVSSRRRKEQVLKLLGEEYFLEEAGSRENFHGPSGLDIGAESPEEVALSIVSEIQAVMARRAGGFLRDRHAPIHDKSCTAAQP